MITVLYVMIIGVLVTTGAIYALLNVTSSSSGDELGILARTAAESGAENAVLRLIRDPAYIGETMTLDGGRTATISVTGGSSPVITSVGTVADVSRRIQVAIQYTNGAVTVTSWKEIP